MTLILEDPAFSAVGNLQVKVAAIGVATLTMNASYEGSRKLVPGTHLPQALSRSKRMYPEDGRGSLGRWQEKKRLSIEVTWGGLRRCEEVRAADRRSAIPSVGDRKLRRKEAEEKELGAETPRDEEDCAV
jgi:hypothetical protein